MLTQREMTRSLYAMKLSDWGTCMKSTVRSSTKWSLGLAAGTPKLDGTLQLGSADWRLCLSGLVIALLAELNTLGAPPTGRVLSYDPYLSALLDLRLPGSCLGPEDRSV